MACNVAIVLVISLRHGITHSVHNNDRVHLPSTPCFKLQNLSFTVDFQVSLLPPVLPSLELRLEYLQCNIIET